MVTGDDRRRSGKISLINIGDHLVPALFAGFGIERNQVVVWGFHVEIVVPHGHPAVADMCAAFGLPEVMPEHAPVVCIDSPGIVGHGDVKRTAYFEDRGLDGASADRNVAGAL